MDLYELPFAKIIILGKNLAEVIIHEGVELNETMVDQFHEFLLTHLPSPFSLLINKVNAYTYDFEGQKKLGALKEIDAIAVIAYSRLTRLSTASVASFPRAIQWNVKIFSNRDIVRKRIEN